MKSDAGHQGSDTWFDRSTDLRVLLNGGGAAPFAYGPGSKLEEVVPQGGGTITLAVWARGFGNWLDREDSESVNAYGRTYQYNLNRNLDGPDTHGGGIERVGEAKGPGLRRRWSRPAPPSGVSLRALFQLQEKQASASKSAIGLDFARLRDHSPANFDWEGALWRRKRCSNFRGW